MSYRVSVTRSFLSFWCDLKVFDVLNLFIEALDEWSTDDDGISAENVLLNRKPQQVNLGTTAPHQNLLIHSHSSMDTKFLIMSGH